MKIKKWLAMLSIFTLSFIAAIWYFGLSGILIGLLSSALLAVLANLEAVGSIVASGYKLGRSISFWFEKNAVEKRLEATITSASKKVNTEAGFLLLPHGVDVKWVEPQDRDAFLEKGKIVICLESSYNEERNLARATMLYVDEDLIYESQRFINITIMKSLAFVMTRKLLMLDRKLGALKCLTEELMKPEIAKTPQIRTYVTGMENMDGEGLFTRILLREFSKLDAKLSPALTNTESRKETKSFTKILKEFVEREEGEEIPSLTHTGTVFRVGLLPVAKLERFDISNFLQAARRHYNEDTETLYVLARGSNVALAKLVISEIQKSNLYAQCKDWEYETIRPNAKKTRTYVSEISKV